MFEGKQGQLGMMMGLMFLVMLIVITVAFIPVIQDSITSIRGQNDLNCVSSKNICGTSGDQTACYNSSKDTETTTCLIFSIYLPYIVIAILIGGISGLLYAQRNTPAPQYNYGYQ